MKMTVGIIGVTGYAGQELLRLLLNHAGVAVRYLASRRLKNPVPAEELLPGMRTPADLEVRPVLLSEAVNECNLLFLALPHGVAMEWAPKLFQKEGLRVIDLSGDFRLHSPALFKQAYGLRRAVYGLPEMHREVIRKARWVANPGCYPTAALLALAPLAEKGWLQSKGTIVDAKSGASGAGRSAKEELLFCEIHENCRPYRVSGHAHHPEMEQELQGLSRKGVRLIFVPHLIPMDRGLCVTAYAPLPRRVPLKQMRALYEERYASEPFVQILPEECWPQTKSVRGTNQCQIGLHLDPSSGHLIVMAVIDNLGKGAAGQAVQNMNLLCDFRETEGLLLPNEG
jgi:N-acetyl-gamma-glutamyl-phosphate reductase